VTRRGLLALLIVFTATRAACGVLAAHPGPYEHGGSILGDIELYRYWGEQMVDGGAVPYRDLQIEYPPGSLPFFAAPALLSGSFFLPLFVATMLLLDLGGLAALISIARRSNGSALGPWVWVGIVPLLGPVVYLRFDLVPAVATIWMVERGARNRWRQAGIWLGLGIAAKLYPFVLLPPLLAVRRWRRSVAAGVGSVLALAFVPFAVWAGSVERSVLRYHAARAIEIESLWGGALLVAARFGHRLLFDFRAESLNALSPWSPELKVAAALIALGVLAVMSWTAWRSAADRLPERFPDVVFATLAGTLVATTVLSPQYLLWLMALGAGAASFKRCTVRGPVMLLAPVALLTQLVFPFLFVRLARLDTTALAVLTLRNVLLLGLAAWAISTVVVGTRLPPSRAGSRVLS
jgi:hypothetical protein